MFSYMCTLKSQKSHYHQWKPRNDSQKAKVTIESVMKLSASVLNCGRPLGNEMQLVKAEPTFSSSFVVS